MRKFKPIAMRCTQEQFDAIKPKLYGMKIKQIDLSSISNNYLTNNLMGLNYVVGNISESHKRDFNRKVYEEWDEKIFLDACEITLETLQEKEQRLLKELEEVRKEIEENKPKIGDICKFWDDDKSRFIVGEFERVMDIEDYSFCVNGLGFKNCMKITDENFLKAYSKL